MHIDDICDLVLDQAAHFDRCNRMLFNAGGGAACSLSLQEMTALCEEITGYRIPMDYSPENRPPDVRILLTEQRRLTDFSGWQPRRAARTVLADIRQMDWHRGVVSTDCLPDVEGRERGKRPQPVTERESAAISDWHPPGNPTAELRRHPTGRHLARPAPSHCFYSGSHRFHCPQIPAPIAG
jgi:hypothetical protein